MKQQKILSPNIILIFSLLSILICWMYGFIGLIFGILAIRSYKLIKQRGKVLKETTLKKLQWAWQMSIIGVILSGVFTIFYVLVIIYGAWISWI